MPPKKLKLTKTQKAEKLKLKKAATAALKLKEQQEQQEQQELIEALKKTKLELKAQTSLNKTLKEQVEDLELDKEETGEDLLDLRQEVRAEKGKAELEKVRLELLESAMKTGLLTIEKTILLAKVIKSDQFLLEFNEKQLEGGVEAAIELFFSEETPGLLMLDSAGGAIEASVTGESAKYDESGE